jgi:hypothetical protein
MSSQQVRCIVVLIIRVTASLTLVMIWIITSPGQFIGRGFTFCWPKEFAGRVVGLRVGHRAPEFASSHLCRALNPF